MRSRPPAARSRRSGRWTREVGVMVGVEVPVMAVRHQIVTFPTIAEGAAPPFPLFFLVGKGYYARPEEQGALLGMSNASDEADPSEHYQIDFDWGYFEK